MFQDYRSWFDEVYLASYRSTPFYQDQPDLMPQPATEFEFFAQISPFVHVVGRIHQSRSYKVPEQRMHDGRWFTVKVLRNFVKLAEYGEHVSAFRLQTGEYVYYVDPLAGKMKNEDIQTVAGSVKVTIAKIASNRGKMDRQMGKAPKA